MTNLTNNDRTQQQRNDWIRLIRHLLDRADLVQLRGIYLLLCGYLGVDRD